MQCYSAMLLQAFVPYGIGVRNIKEDKIETFGDCYSSEIKLYT
jgi:hypothetical protein